MDAEQRIARLKQKTNHACIQGDADEYRRVRHGDKLANIQVLGAKSDGIRNRDSPVEKDSGDKTTASTSKRGNPDDLGNMESRCQCRSTDGIVKNRRHEDQVDGHNAHDGWKACV